MNPSDPASSSTLFAIWLAMTAVTIITRVTPLLIGGWLKKQSWIGQVSRYLPCMVLVLLVIYDVQHRIEGDHEKVIPTAVGLAVALVHQMITGRLIVSIALAVLTYALTEYVLHSLLSAG